MREQVHPDLALLLEPEHQSICCLVFPVGACDLEALHPFHRYEAEGMTALLFENVGEISSFMRSAEEALEKAGSAAGMSGPFALSVSARGCLTKARIALETGQRHAPGRRLYTMGEFGETALIEVCAAALEATDFCAGDFCDDVLSRLEEIDDAEQTQYVQSLRGYLENELDLRRAAAIQGVHRNTLAYRIRRIQERFSLDLENKNTCFELLFSFWLRTHFPDAQEKKTDAAAHGQVEAVLWRYAERLGREEAKHSFPMCVCYVGTEHLSDSDRDALVLKLSGLCGACAFHEEEIYLACAPEEIGRLAGLAAKVCGEMSCPVIVSGTFDSARIRQKLALCRWAARIAGPGVTHLHDMVSTLFFAAVSRYAPLAPYLREEVIRVMDEDATKGSALSRSLFVFLLNFNDMKEAAGKLGMHRNTMEYQMRKIESFIGGPLDKRRRFMMMCTYRMLALPDMDTLP